MERPTLTDMLPPSPQESPRPTKISEKMKALPPWLHDLLTFLIVVLFVIVPFRMFIAQPYLVTGASMDPTFKTGQYLIVDQFTYHFKDPERGSVIIFKYPRNPKEYFIKRVIGLPNETIRVSQDGVRIINASHPEGFLLNEPYIVYARNDEATYKLGPNEYFVMGDNRIGSSDSRMWGPLPRDLMIGRPLVSLFPFTTIGVFPGDARILIEQNLQN